MALLDARHFHGHREQAINVPAQAWLAHVGFEETIQAAKCLLTEHERLFCHAACELISARARPHVHEPARMQRLAALCAHGTATAAACRPSQ